MERATANAWGLVISTNAAGESLDDDD